MSWHNEFVLAVKTCLNNSSAGEGSKITTLRALAKALEVTPGALSELLNGKRRFSAEKAIAALKLLGDSNHLITKIRLSENINFANDSDLPDLNIVNTLEPLDYALCGYFEMSKKIPIPDIARCLGMSPQELKTRTKNLIEKKILILDETGRPYRTSGKWRAGFPEMKDEKIRSYIKGSLELSEKAVDELSLTENTFFTQTFSADASIMKVIKEELNSLMNKISAMSAALESRENVFQFSCQAFEIDFTKSRIKE